jgi:hypothetical protein
MPELSMSSKSPTKNTERRWWEPPKKMQRMDPASSEYHNKNKTLPKRFYLDHRKSSLKYTQVSIPDPDPDFLPIPDPGSWGQKGNRSGSATILRKRLCHYKLNCTLSHTSFLKGETQIQNRKFIGTLKKDQVQETYIAKNSYLPNFTKNHIKVRYEH